MPDNKKKRCGCPSCKEAVKRAEGLLDLITDYCLTAPYQRERAIDYIMDYLDNGLGPGHPPTFR